MATKRDMDQMLKCGLEMKQLAQKVIDFAKMQGGGEGDEGEEDLEKEVSMEEEEGYEEEEEAPEEESKPGPLNKPGKMAILIALAKKRAKK